MRGCVHVVCFSSGFRLAGNDTTSDNKVAVIDKFRKDFISLQDRKVGGTSEGGFCYGVKRVDLASAVGVIYLFLLWNRSSLKPRFTKLTLVQYTP
jgi:hypothetical protein